MLNVKYEVGKIYNCIEIESISRNDHNRLIASVRCVHCGRHRVMRASDVVHTRTNSCECQITKHGLNTSRIYAIYHNMKYRCYTETAPAYPHYGGRGITICDEWLNPDAGFQSFYDWSMKNGYRDNLTIDRIDIDGNYSPSNCRWITKSRNTGLSNKDHPRRKRSAKSQSTIESIAA